MNPAPAPARLSSVLPLLGVLAAALGVWAWGEYRAEQQKAARARAHLTACQEISFRLGHLSTGRTIALESELAAGELVRRIESAARQSGMMTGALARISPEPARKLPGSAYDLKPTRLDLRQVSMKQLGGFLHAISADGSGLNVYALSLSAPRGEDAAELWDAQVVLSHLLYRPPVTPATPGTPERKGVAP